MANGTYQPKNAAEVDTAPQSDYDNTINEAEGGVISNERREESRESFYRRANEKNYTVRERGKISCGYYPVTDKTGRAGQTEKALQELGIPVIVHEGLEANIDGTYQPKNAAEVDTTVQTNYDNVNDQGGIADGREKKVSSVHAGGAEGPFGVQNGPRTENGNRPRIQKTVGGTTGGTSQSIPHRTSSELITLPAKFKTHDYISPETGSQLEEVQSAFNREYGIPAYVVKKSAWTRDNPAYTRGGNVFICEDIDAGTLSTAIPHESSHVMAVYHFEPYMNFLPGMRDNINSNSDAGKKLLVLTGEHCGIDPLSMETDAELINTCKDINLAEVCIVSSCAWENVPEGATTGVGTNLPQLTVGVVEARGEKCPRCWMHSEEADENGLCKRCAAVISKMDIEI